MRLGFICLNAAGHINPMTTLARRLQGRNHEVLFLYQSEAAGLSCVRGPENDQFLRNRREVSKMQGDGALEFSIGALMAQTEMESEGIRQEAAMEPGDRNAVYWFISLAALTSLLVGFFFLLGSATPRTPGAEQLELAAQGAPSHAEATFGEAIQALGVQH